MLGKGIDSKTYDRQQLVVSMMLFWINDVM